MRGSSEKTRLKLERDKYTIEYSGDAIVYTSTMYVLMDMRVFRTIEQDGHIFFAENL